MTRRFDRDFDTEALEIDDGGEDYNGCEKVHDVREVLAVEGFPECSLLVWPGQEEMEKRDDGTFEFRTPAGIDGRGGKRFPDDRFADVGSDEKGDAASQPVSLLQQLVEQNDNQTGNHQLNDQQDTDTSTEIRGLTVETSEDINHSLTERHDDSEEFLSSLV